MPIDRAEPAIIDIAVSTSSALRSAIFFCAISRTCAVVMVPADSLPGSLLPDLRFAAWRRDRVLEFLTAQMHVRHEREEPDLFVEGQARRDGDVVLVRRDHEIGVRDGDRVGLASDRRLGENQA